MKTIEEAVPEIKWTLENLAEGFQLFKSAFGFFYSMDPSMMWAPKLMPTVEEETFLEKSKSKRSQTEITVYFCQVKLSAPPSFISPFTSTLSPASATPRQRDQPHLFLLLSLLNVKMVRLKTYDDPLPPNE